MYHSSIQGTMFRRENGVWFGNYTRNGKRVKVSLGTTDKRIASLRLQELLTHPSNRHITMSDCIDGALADMEIRKLKSIYRMRHHSKPVVAALGTYKVGDITEKVIQDFVLENLRLGYANATCNRMLHIISSALKWARSNGYIQYVPYIKRLAETNIRNGFFTDAEMERLLLHLPEYLQDYVLFAYLTGWRKSEISSLQWSMLDFEHKIILLPDSKNGEPRILPLVGEIEQIINRRCAMKECRWVFHYTYKDKVCLPIRDFRHHWLKACRLAGLNKRLFHDCRRSAVKNALGKGLSEQLTMRLCGHKTRSMLTRYHILVADDLRLGLERLLSQNSPRLKGSRRKYLKEKSPLDSRIPSPSRHALPYSF